MATRMRYLGRECVSRLALISNVGGVDTASQHWQADGSVLRINRGKNEKQPPGAARATSEKCHQTFVLRRGF